MTECIWAFDERRNIALPGGSKEALDFAVEQWLALAKKAIEEKGLFTCALSGGSTPKSIYKALALQKAALDWSKVELYFSDERTVPLDNPESNYHMAWEAGFKELVKPSQLFPMYVASEPQEAACAYDRLISGKVFDLVMLGMGDDGHIASLFPYTHALRCEERDVIANFLPEKETWRITLTYPAINRATAITLYVFGSNKAERVKEVFTAPYDPTRLPAQKIGTPENKALWILDKEAAFALNR